MKYLSVILVCAFLLAMAGCQDSAVSKKLAECDSLVITFNAPKSDSIINTFSATQKSAIHKMAQFVGSKTTEEFKCGFDGNLVFFTKGQAVLPVVFKSRDANCRHFLYEWEGKTRSTRLSQEAADFLKDLEGNRQ